MVQIRNFPQSRRRVQKAAAGACRVHSQVAELMSRVDSMLQIATFAAKADGAKNSKADFLVDAQFAQPVAKE